MAAALILAGTLRLRADLAAVFGPALDLRLCGDLTAAFAPALVLRLRFVLTATLALVLRLRVALALGLGLVFRLRLGLLADAIVALRVMDSGWRVKGMVVIWPAAGVAQ
ncbi:MAG: hypothetical protein HY244_13670 [Rhizobiales bacterium]|nr:hypothetical protein [Hyphomicrobiales bacterium]